MDHCPMCFNRLCAPLIALTLLFSSASSFATYNPPSGEVCFQASETEIINMDGFCSTAGFSWEATGGIYCEGDDRSSCTGCFSYHSTNKNNCGGSTNPDPDPDPDPLDPPDGWSPMQPPATPDYIDENATTNAGLLATIHRGNATINHTLQQASNLNIFTLNRIINDTSKTRDHTYTANQLLTSIRDNLATTGDSGVVDQLKSMERSLLLHLRSKYEWADAENNRRLFLETYLDNFSGVLGNMALNTTTRADVAEVISKLESIDSNIANGSGSGGDNASLLSQLDDLEYLLESNTAYAGDSYDKMGDLKDYLSDISDFTENLETKLTQNTSKINNKLNAENNELKNKLTQVQNGIVDAINNSGDGDGDETESDTVVENACTSFTCSSESPACYIARKQWELDCKNKSSIDDGGDLDSLTGQITDFLNHEDSSVDNIDLGTVDSSTIMNKYNNGNGFKIGSDTCPAPYTIDAGITSFTLDLKPFCDLASVIRWFVIAFATISAGLMISKYS